MAVETGISPKDLMDAIEAQRNEAMSRGALLAAKCAQLQRELDGVRAELAAAQKPTGSAPESAPTT